MIKLTDLLIFKRIATVGLRLTVFFLFLSFININLLHTLRSHVQF